METKKKKRGKVKVCTVYTLGVSIALATDVDICSLAAAPGCQIVEECGAASRVLQRCFVFGWVWTKFLKSKCWLIFHPSSSSLSFTCATRATYCEVVECRQSRGVEDFVPVIAQCARFIFFFFFVDKLLRLRSAAPERNGVSTGTANFAPLLSLLLLLFHSPRLRPCARFPGSFCALTDRQFLPPPRRVKFRCKIL